MEYSPELLEKVVRDFNLDLRDYGNRYTGRCPLHNGDNKVAFSIYKETGVWKCFSRACHDDYPSGIFGLTKALLARENPQVTNREVLSFFNENLKSSFSSINYLYNEDSKAKTTNLTRDIIRARLQIPAKYFIDRGINEQILDRYDIGLCITSKKQMSGRCVVPIYDKYHKYILGFSGRATSDNLKPKWLHTKFEKRKVLYNLWFAASFIKISKTAILTEGPIDVWKLEQCGIHCGLAVLGVYITSQQLRLLSQTGANNVVLLLDNDKAGKESTNKLVKQLKNLYNVITPSIDPYNDLGDMPDEEVKKILRPIIKKYEN